MKDFDSISSDYVKAIKKIKTQEKEIELLRQSVRKYKILANNAGRYRQENNTLIEANIKLADAIKQYNPNHFGGGEGRHDTILEPLNSHVYED